MSLDMCPKWLLTWLKCFFSANLVRLCLPFPSSANEVTVFVCMISTLHHVLAFPDIPLPCSFKYGA
jgi:hypothetical protein